MNVERMEGWSSITVGGDLSGLRFEASDLGFETPRMGKTSRR